MYLLDTNHCSRLIDAHPAIVRRLATLGDARVVTCVIVQGELTFMVERSERRVENADKLRALLAEMDVLPADARVGEIYGKLKAGLLARYGPRTRAGRRRTRLVELGFSDNDLWIAAIAQRHGLTVVSADRSFERMGDVIDLAVERWWSPEGEAPGS